MDHHLFVIITCMALSSLLCATLSPNMWLVIVTNTICIYLCGGMQMFRSTKKNPQKKEEKQFFLVVISNILSINDIFVF